MKKEISVNKGIFTFVFECEYSPETGPTYSCGGTPAYYECELEKVLFQGVVMDDISFLSDDFIDDAEEKAWKEFWRLENE